MGNRERLRDTYTTPNKLFTSVCAGLNRLGQWCNAFDAQPPIRVITAGWGVHLMWAPWDSPFIHPWRVSLTAESKLNVAGGNLNTGAALVAVTGLTNLTASNGRKVWLLVRHYYNISTASTYSLNSGTSAWPSSTHNSTYVETVLKVAEIVSGTLYQYLYSDQFVPRINPPLPDTSNPYVLMAISGTIQWVKAGTCPEPTP
jgi:hypothetical protein